MKLDLAKLKTKFQKNDVQFLLAFIQSLPLDEDVLGAIGVTKPEDAERITLSKYEVIADILDSLRSEAAIQQAFSLEPPASSRLWRFILRFTQQSTAPVTGEIFWGIRI